jgi:hypothetical protein
MAYCRRILARGNVIIGHFSREEVTLNKPLATSFLFSQSSSKDEGRDTRKQKVERKSK